MRTKYQTKITCPLTNDQIRVQPKVDFILEEPGSDTPKEHILSKYQYYSISTRSKELQMGRKDKPKANTDDYFNTH